MVRSGSQRSWSPVRARMPCSVPRYMRRRLVMISSSNCSCGRARSWLGWAADSLGLDLLPGSDHLLEILRHVVWLSDEPGKAVEAAEYADALLLQRTTSPGQG